MSANPHLTYQMWRDSRLRSARVAGIDIRLRVVSAGLLNSCDDDLLRLLNNIDEGHARGSLSRRDIALMMRNALEAILPNVLDSPDWLMQALNEFSDSEVIELYNVVMYGAAGEIPF